MNTYAVAIVVEGKNYSFHVPNRDAVYDLIASVDGIIESLQIWEETHVGTSTSFREMDSQEIVSLCEGFDYVNAGARAGAS
jgi:hypothetical protein